MKYHIEKNTIRESLVIPLYARALCTRRFPHLFSDPLSVELLEELDYDFTTLERTSGGLMQTFGAMEAAMRQSDLAFEVRDYLRDHPQAAVVNLGCGLDQTGRSCDNGQCRIYNVRTKQVRALCAAMAERFPGGRLVFDAAGQAAVKLMLKTWVKQAGIRDVGAYFSVQDAEKELAAWSDRLTVSSRGYMLGYQPIRGPGIRPIHRLLARIADGPMKLKIVRMEFQEGSR